MNNLGSMISLSSRKIFGTGGHRTAFARGVISVVSVNLLFMTAGSTFAGTGNLPGRTSDGITAQPNYTISGTTGTFTGGGTWTWKNAASEGFSIGSGYTVSAPDGGKFIDKSGSVTTIDGILSAPGADVYLINPSGISFSGGTINVGGLVAAAMGGFSFGTSYGVDDVMGNVNAGEKGGKNFTVLIGKSVTGVPNGARVVQTDGMAAGSTFTLAEAGNGATITFTGTTGDGTSLSAEAVDLSGSTVAGGTVTADDIKGAVTQSGGKIAARTATAGVVFEGAITQNGGTIDAGANTLTLNAGGTIGGTITANKIDAGANNLTWSAGDIGTTIDAGTLTIANAGATTVSKVGTIGKIDAAGKELTWSAGDIGTAIDAGTLTIGNSGTTAISSDINVTTINATGKTLTQTAGTITANEITGVFTQNGGTIRDNGAGLTISQALGTQNGTIDVGANTLTLSEGGTLGGTVNAGKINAAGKDVTQTAGSITVSGTDGLVASKFTQSAGSISADKVNAEVAQSGNGTITANEITGVLMQNGGTINAKGTTLTLDAASTVGGTVNASVIDNKATLTQTAGTITANEIKGALAQNGGTIADRNGSGLKLDQAVADGTQKGAINVSSLELGTGNDYALTGNNKIKQLTGSASTVQLNNGANAVDLKDLTTTTLNISKAGAVTDSGSVDLGQLTIGGATSLVLDNTKATVKGVTTSGDVGLVVGSDNAAIAGDVTGGNVTLQAASGEGLTVANSVKATGDLLLKADGGAVSVSANQSAGGSMVLQGTSVSIVDSSLNAGKGVGVAATADDGSVTVSGTSAVNAPDVVVKAGKEITIADTVAMKSKADAAKNDANLVVYVEDEDNGELNVKLDGTTTENIVIAKAASAPVSAGDTVTLNKFVYKTAGDIDINFTGSQLSLEGKSVKVGATSESVSIFDASAQASGGGTVEAANAFGEKVSVSAGTADGDSPHGLVASEGAVTFNGAGTALTLDSGTISGTSVTLNTKSFEQKAGDITTDGDLAITAANGNVGQSGGKITANAGTATFAAESGNIKLDRVANDFATVTSKAKDIAIVDANDLTIGADGMTATDGSVTITAGGALTATASIEAAKDVNLAGASFENTAAVASKDNAGNVAITTTEGNATIGAAVNAKNVTIQSAGAVSENAVVNANGGDKVVVAENGDITVANNFVANNAIYDAGNAGSVTFATSPDLGTSGNLGIRTQTMDGIDIDGVKAASLVVETTQGDIVLENGKPAGVGTLAIKAAGDIEVTSDETVNFGAGSVTAGDETLAVAGLEAGGDLTVTANGSVNIELAGATAGGDVVLTANDGGDIDAGTVTAGGAATLTGNDVTTTTTTAGGATTVNATTVSGGTYNGGTVDITATGAANLTAVNANGQATVNAAQTTGGQIAGGTVVMNVGGNIANDIQSGGQATITSGSIGNNAINAGALELNTGAVNSGDITVGGAAVLNTGDINANTLTAGNAEFNTGAVNVPQIQINGAATGATGDLVFEQFTAGNIDMDTGAVNDHGTITTDDLALRAGGDVDIVLDMGNNGNLNQLTGNDITVEFPLANGVINLGEVNAGGNLVITAENIGSGSNAGGGFNDANGGANNLTGDNITLNVAGRVGTLQDPVEVQVNGGTITVNGGAASDLSFVHLSLAGADGVQFEGDTSYGLVILNNQVVGGNPRLIRLINRAFAFTVNAPEIKSAQGVFGNPAFVHSKMDIVDTRSMGVVDTLSVGRLDYGGMFDDILGRYYDGSFASWNPPINLDEGSQLDKQIGELKEQVKNSMIDVQPSNAKDRKPTNAPNGQGQK